MLISPWCLRGGCKVEHCSTRVGPDPHPPSRLLGPSSPVVIGEVGKRDGGQAEEGVSTHSPRPADGRSRTPKEGTARVRLGAYCSRLCCTESSSGTRAQSLTIHHRSTATRSNDLSRLHYSTWKDGITLALRLITSLHRPINRETHIEARLMREMEA